MQIAYILALVRRGVDDETIKDRIRSERSDWENHRGANRMERYLDDSLKKARSMIGSSGYPINIYDEKKEDSKVWPWAAHPPARITAPTLKPGPGTSWPRRGLSRTE